MDTGFPSSDAQSDFNRARRRAVLSRLNRRLRREPGDVRLILPFDEVIAALGHRGERRIGLETIPLDSIVGTVDRTREFDRSFRPTSRRVRLRWQRIAEAIRRGESMPPIDVYRIGDMHFVRDGHHRVSVARHLGLDVIEAYVTEIQTAVQADRKVSLRDLAIKSHERLFFDRVPLPPALRPRIALSRATWWANLAEAVEAWGFRAMQARGKFMTREQVAEEWFRTDFEPVVSALREAELIRGSTDAEAYIRVSALRYFLLRTHEWDEAVIERLREELSRPPGRDEDTMVHVMRRDPSR